MSIIDFVSIVLLCLAFANVTAKNHSDDEVYQALGISSSLHYTLPLLRIFLIDAPFTCCYLARGAGKTSRGSSLKIKRNVEALPKSQGALLCHSYVYFYDTILPILKTAWKEFGWHQDVHYWIGKKPPKGLGLPDPYTAIDDKEAKYFIFFYNGTVAKVCSMDAQALFNGNSFDWALLFEARKLDGVKVIQDFFPTIRGNADQPVIGMDGFHSGKVFSDMPEHGSIWLESDLPRQPKEKWILEYLKKHDEELSKGILIIQKHKYKLLDEYKALTAEYEEAAKKRQKDIEKRKKEIDIEVEEIEDTLRFLRGTKDSEGLVHVEIADTLSNIHILGIRGIKNLKNSITNERDWDISVLGKLLIEVEDCFYAGVTEERHGRSINYDLDTLNRLTKLSMTRDSRWDIDIRADEQLDIAIDNNFAVNFVTVSIRRAKERYLCKVFYNVSSESKPKDITHTVNDFCNYYRFHKNKKVRFIYNNTFVAGRRYGQESISQKVSKTLTDKGWEVEEFYLGQAMEHKDLFDKYVNLFSGELPWEWKYSIHNCEVWFIAAKQTQVEMRVVKGRLVYKKRKATERLKSIPVIEAPHVTEAVDQFLHFDIKFPYTQSRGFFIQKAKNK